MGLEPIMSLLGVLTGAAGAYFVLRAYGQSVKSAESDPERVRRFVESAPLERLNNIKAR